jgi:SnoaL-like domain
MTDTEFAELLDREKIRNCLARLARGEDRRNAELVTGAFWPCASIAQGVFSGSFDEYLAWVVPGSPDIPVTQHVLGQSYIDLYTDTAIVETHVLAYHRVAAAGGDRDTVIGGRYLDWMEKIDGEWRISRRTMIFDWCQDLGRAADWSAGLMGTPFDTTQHTGRAHGDPSERILGDRWARQLDEAAE